MTTTKRFALTTLSASLFAASAMAAQYDIEELATNDRGIRSFAVAIDDQGQAISQVQFPFNPPIDVALLNLEEGSALRDQLTDPDAVANGNINNDDLVTLYSIIRGSSDGLTVQKLETIRTYLADANGGSEVVPFDQAATSYDGLTRSVDTYGLATNSVGHVAGMGTAPYTKIDVVNDDDETVTFLTRDFIRRGFVNLDGAIIPLVPEFNDLGGISAARGISDNLWVAGYESTGLTPALENSFSQCQEDDTSDDGGEESGTPLPIEVCFTQLANAVTGTREFGFLPRATLWKLNQAGEIVDKQQYGLLYEPDPENNVETSRNSRSEAIDVNDNGIGVGYAEKRVEHRNNRIFSMPSIFKDGEIVDFIDDTEHSSGVTSLINNNNLASGYVNTLVNGYQRTKFFVYDVDNEELVFPEDFFPGSSSVPRDMNDQNVIVGDGEVDSVTGQGTTRRRHGFIYDHNEGLFQDLNDLIGCDAPYTIVQANGINEAGEVAATALIEKPEYNIAGEPVTDDDGNEVTSSNVVAVKLTPVPGGAVEDCGNDEDDNFERQAGGMTALLGLLLGIIGWRRVRR